MSRGTRSVKGGLSGVEDDGSWVFFEAEVELKTSDFVELSPTYPIGANGREFHLSLLFNRPNVFNLMQRKLLTEHSLFTFRVVSTDRRSLLSAREILLRDLNLDDSLTLTVYTLFDTLQISVAEVTPPPPGFQRNYEPVREREQFIQVRVMDLPLVSQ